MRGKREMIHLYVDSTQDQAKPHKNSDQTELKRGGSESLERENDHQPNEELYKSEKQSKPQSAHQIECSEKSETTHEEIPDEKPVEAINRGRESESEWERDYGGPRERMKRHRTEVSGHVWIPDMWGQEELLKDWIDSSDFDACLMPKGIISARASLIEDGRTSNSAGIRVENSC